MSKEGRDDWFRTTGRVENFARSKVIGALGTNWCPAENDKNFLEALYQGTLTRDMKFILNNVKHLLKRALI